MHPSATLSNRKPGTLKPKLESFSSSSASTQVSERFPKQTPIPLSRPGSFRKTASKSQSDLTNFRAFLQKTPTNHRIPPKNAYIPASMNSNYQSSQLLNCHLQDSSQKSAQHRVYHYSPQAAAKKPEVNSKIHTRNQSQNTATSQARNDENPIVNRIPFSPISIKRAASPQMMGSIDQDLDPKWTESSTYENIDIQAYQSLNPYDTRKYSFSTHIQNVPIQDISKGAVSNLPVEYQNLHSLLDITNTRVPTDQKHTLIERNIATEGANFQIIHQDPPPSKDMLMSFSNIASTEINSSIQTSPTKLLSPQSNHSSLKNGEMKSPGRTRREQASLKSEASNQARIKTSNAAPLRTTNNRLRVTNSSTFEGVKTYLNKLNKFDLSKSTSILKNMFFQKNKRLKCSCDIHLDENETCSKAMAWITIKYKQTEFGYLKSTYEKILSENKLIEAEYVRQIQKDLPRTSPQNKYFSEGSEGMKSLESILNTFAKYDPQIGYVQGMNFIAASLLYHAEEFLAFWLLVMIFEIFEMRDIYLPKLPGLSKHCQIIDILIFNYQPQIYRHLCQHEIKVDVFCTEWILALFSSVIPVENMDNFYDRLLSEGWPFFYKTILAFLQHFQKQIKQETDLMGILTVLKSQNHIIKNSNKTKNPLSVDWNSLFQIAQKIEIDSNFIYKMHSNFDAENQWFRTSFLENK